MNSPRIKPIEPTRPVARPSSAIKHSAAIQIENSISLLQRRTWNVLLANAYDELTNREVHTIKVQDLMDVLGFESKNERYLKDALKALTGCTVEWNLLGKDGTQRWGVTALIAQAEIESGVCTYAYSPVLRRRLHNPNMYAKISLSIQKRFNSKHALALYELCLDYLFEAKSYGETPYIPIATYRKLMGIDDDTYPDFKRLNQRVIKEPIEEINAVTDLNVRVEYKRKERSVDALKFRIKYSTDIAETRVLEGGIQPDQSPLIEIVQSLIEAGLPKRDAIAIFERGFDNVQPERRSNRTDFAQYVREKVDLLNRRNREGKVKNPIGFLLEAIREDYTNSEYASREQAQKRQAVSQDLQSLLKEKETVQQAHQEAIERVCRRFMEENAERAQFALDAALKDNPFCRSFVDRKKTALENYQSRPMLAGAINHQLKTDYPEVFAAVEYEFSERIRAIDEKIAVLEAARDS